MNKNDIKRVIKQRIENQKNEVSNARQNVISKAAKDLFHEIYSAEDLQTLNTAGTEYLATLKSFNNTVGNIINMTGNPYAFNAVKSLEEQLYRNIKDILWKAHYIDWTSRDVSRYIESYHESQVPKIKEAFEAIYEADYVRRANLNKLETELLSIVTSSKTAVIALETLKELGIEFDIPEAKTVTSNLPAVVALSVSPELFNKSLTTNNN